MVSTDLRDALKGSVFETTQAGFASGKPEGNEESIKFGILVHGLYVMDAHQVETETIHVVFLGPIFHGLHDIAAYHRPL